MSNQNRRNKNRAQKESTDVENTEEQQQSGAGDQGSDQTDVSGTVTETPATGGETTGTDDGEDKPKPTQAQPSFANKSAPQGDPKAVQLFKSLVGEYAIGNTSRELDQAKAKRVTRGLCTALLTLGKLNGADVKQCLSHFIDVISADDKGAFSEGVMFRYATATQSPRMFVDLMTLSKRYSALGENRANITKLVDVNAASEHFTSKAVQVAVTSFFK